ncbi:hypothetical protein M0R89_09785 [Halorussus limi]|uniref:Uncharacterized protein n=1 Tax=Halorussus limi TaxID=2938695 RepID=A0A8U0HPF8_9EURY|nr:hypothetical protein [Halorussus limi]UPV72840.1 hypothetical protein M0R89_09785 [Halorussus limi]
MFGIETLSGNAQAAAIVGAVIGEALTLNAVYTALERIAGPALTEAVTGA